MHDRALSGLRVIYIDDDAINLRIVSDILSACDISVECASSGSEGLEALVAQAFDLVLLDIHMPQMGGAETLRHIRALPGAGPMLPEVAFTADLSQDEVYYRGLGFDAFVAKPVGVRQLLAGLLEGLQSARERDHKCVSGRNFDIPQVARQAEP